MKLLRLAEQGDEEAYTKLLKSFGPLDEEPSTGIVTPMTKYELRPRPQGRLRRGCIPGLRGRRGGPAVTAGPVYLAARFDGEAEARIAYLELECLIAAESADVSCFRFLAGGTWHVAVVAADGVPERLQGRVRVGLGSGQTVPLQEEVLALLLGRHREVMRYRLPWVEGHYHQEGL